MSLNGRQMIRCEVWKWNNAKGGMRFAFPPYELRAKFQVAHLLAHLVPKLHLGTAGDAKLNLAHYCVPKHSLGTK
jgi:hypothetical protein